MESLFEDKGQHISWLGAAFFMPFGKFYGGDSNDFK